MILGISSQFWKRLRLPGIVCRYGAAAGTVLVCSALSVFAQYGGYGGEFLRYGAGGRALALGGAFTGVADDASAIFYNPAGLVQLDRPTLSYMSSTLFLDSRYQFLATVFPFYTSFPKVEKVSLGLAYVEFGMEGFEIREAGTHRRLGNFADRQSAFIAPVALDWVGDWGRISVAAELNVVSHDLASYRDHGWGFGFSLFAQPFMLPVGLRSLEDVRLPLIGQFFSLENFMRLRIGLAFRHLPSLTLFREAENLPDIFRFGLSYARPVWSRRVWLLASYDRIDGLDLKGRSVFGIELGSSFAAGLTTRLRVAYRGGDVWKQRGCVWGLGLESHEYRLGNVTGTLALDYVYDKHDVLGAATALYLSVQISGGAEDVLSPDFFRKNRNNPRVLRRALTWHPRDIRRVGWRADREAIDERYRDGLGAGISTGVAELLMEKAESRGDLHAASRYDEFVLGFRRLNRLAAERLRGYRLSLGSERESVAELIPKYLERRRKMPKCYNAPAIRFFLDLCAASGDSNAAGTVLAKEARQNKCYSDARRLFHEALMGVSGALDSLEKQGGVGSDTLLYLRFVEAVRRGDLDELQEIARQADGRNRFAALPMAPLVADGTLRDDAMLLAGLRGTADSGSVRNTVVSLMLEHPLSDAALIAAEAFGGRGSQPSNSSAAAKAIVKWYRSRARAGGVIWYRKFREYRRVTLEELP